MTKLAVVRVRGNAQVRKKVKDTLHMLRLTKAHYCTLADDDSSYRGMLKKVKEMVTWGPIKLGVLEKLLGEKGEFEGGEPVSDESVQEVTSFDSVGDLAEAIHENDLDLEEIEDFRNVFRLRPPRKGYGSLNRAYEHGGATGYRGEEINELLIRMI